MHKQPASPKKPCKWTMFGEHQWITLRRKKLCWLCGARWPKEWTDELS